MYAACDEYINGPQGLPLGQKANGNRPTMRLQRSLSLGQSNVKIDYDSVDSDESDDTDESESE